MDQIALVERPIGDGDRLIERFAADGNPVKAAFWVKTAEEGLWFLYIATELVDRHGPAATYRLVHESLRKLGETDISASEIKVIGENNPIAKDVFRVMAQHSGQSPLQVRGNRLGSMELEQAVILPSRLFTFAQSNLMTKEEVGGEILRLMNRGPGILQPSKVTLKDGTAFSGIPFSLQLDAQQSTIVQFIADGEATPRIVPLDEIASIG